jgi:hypothetical protein
VVILATDEADRAAQIAFMLSAGAPAAFDALVLGALRAVIGLFSTNIGLI